jgi:hypothetical protein
MSSDRMEQFSDDDLRDLRKLLQDVALKAYPNPERRGCPGPEVLQEIASAPTPFEHPAYGHLKTCSPCLREMLDVRRQEILRRRNAARKRQVLYGVVSAIAAVLILALWLSRRQPSPPNLQRAPSQQKAATKAPESPKASAQTPELIALDFGGLARTRGGAAPSEIAPFPLPSALIVLRITLPFGSDDGRYDIEIRRGDVAALVRTSGTARIDNGDTKLEISPLDLSSLPPGRYELFFRHADATWQHAPIAIK